jgi:hypothetical protein
MELFHIQELKMIDWLKTNWVFSVLAAYAVVWAVMTIYKKGRK